MCSKAPDYSKWLKSMIKEIKELETMRWWKVVKLSSTRTRLLWKFFSHLFSIYYSACPSAYISSRMAFFGSWRRVCFHFKRPCRKASIFTWKGHPFTILVTETACLCSSAFIPSCKLFPILHALSWSLSESWYEATSDWWVFLYLLRLQHHWVSIAHEWRSACQRQKTGMKQLQTDECVFTRYVINIIGPPSLTNEDLLVNGKFLNMEIVPMQMCVYRLCSHLVAAMILVMYVDNNGFRYNWSWCKNLRSLSSKMVALTCNVKESSIGFYRFAIIMTRSLALLVVAKRLTSIVSCPSTAWKFLMLVSCRWIQAPTLNRFSSLTHLIKLLCVLLQRWLASFSTLLLTLCLSSATPWVVLLGTCPRRRRHISPL